MNIIFKTLFACTLLGLVSCSPKTPQAEPTTKADSIPQAEPAKPTSQNFSNAMAGTYKYGEDDKTGVGEIKIYPLNDSTAIFHVEIVGAAPAHNMGSLLGRLRMTAENVGTYDSQIEEDDFDCSFKIELKGETLVVTTNGAHSDCGFGHNIYVDGQFTRSDKAVPTDFTDFAGEKVAFSGLDIKKYNNPN